MDKPIAPSSFVLSRVANELHKVLPPFGKRVLESSVREYNRRMEPFQSSETPQS